MLIRLQKHLAACGIASRRAAEEMIKSGHVKVNGKVVDVFGMKIDTEKDIVSCNGQTVRNEAGKAYIMLNKPVGYVTTVKDQFGRPTVMDLVKDTSERLFPVGRLDWDTSGLVLLTNDGELAYRLTHPKYEVKKVYIARIHGLPTRDELKKFRLGMEIEDYRTAPAEIEIIQGNQETSSVKITIREGRNRQIRKMCESIGHRVVSLKRVAMGGLSLGDLRSGGCRSLTKKERDLLLHCNP